MIRSLLRLTPAFLALGLMAGCSPADEPSTGAPGFFDCIRETDAAVISAHRAGPAPGFPENAVETIENTLAPGPAVIEMDVRTTKDGVLVLMHDDTIDRTTTGTGAVADLTQATLRQATLVDANGAPTAFRIPTLEDALAAVKGRGIASLDLKDTDHARLAEAVTAAGMTDQIVLIAYSMTQAIMLRDALPGAVLSVTVRNEEDIEKIEDRLGNTTLVIAWTGTRTPDHVLNTRLASDGIEAGFGAFSTADRKPDHAAREAYRALHAQGIDMIATDRPALARSALEAHGPSACWAQYADPTPNAD